MKLVANEILGVFERYKKGDCTYDRALEDVSKIISKFADERPIVGYVTSEALKPIFESIINSKKRDPEKLHLFDCKIHWIDIEKIERMYGSL